MKKLMFLIVAFFATSAAMAQYMMGEVKLDNQSSCDTWIYVTQVHGGTILPPTLHVVHSGDHPLVFPPPGGYTIEKIEVYDVNPVANPGVPPAYVLTAPWATAFTGGTVNFEPVNCLVTGTNVDWMGDPLQSTLYIHN